jgi:hypothetical protein
VKGRARYAWILRCRVGQCYQRSGPFGGAP